MRHIVDYIKKNKILLLVIVPAFLVNMLIIFPSGSYYCFKEKCGYFFWGVHGNDAIWHLAITGASFNQFPFQHPIFAGAVMNGYNIFTDYILFLLSKIGITPLISYFKIFPLIWFILFTYLAIKLALKIHKNPIFTSIFLFFIFFGGSFSYLFTLFHKKTILGSAGMLAMQSGLTLTNIQFASSLIVILLILNILRKNDLSLKENLTLALLAGLNLAIKFYAGVVSISIIFCYFAASFFKDKNFRNILMNSFLLAFFSLMAIVVFYNPFESVKSGSALTFSPLALVHSMIEEPDLFYLPKLANARYFLMSKNRIGPRLILIEAFTLGIFLIFNFGTRIFGFFYLLFKTIQKKISKFEITVVFGILTSVLMSVFFIQKGEWWNTIQFIYYGFFLSSIFIAELLYLMLRKDNLLFKLAVFIILLLTIPNNIDLITGFFSFPAPAYLPKEEIAALNFLKKQPEGVIFTMPYEKKDREKFNAPQPLFAYDDTSYVPAFSNKRVYLAQTHCLRITGVDYSQRLVEITNLQSLKLKDLAVDYIYLQKEHSSFADYLDKINKEMSSTWIKILDNEKVIIFKRLHQS